MKKHNLPKDSSYLLHVTLFLIVPFSFPIICLLSSFENKICLNNAGKMLGHCPGVLSCIISCGGCISLLEEAGVG